MKSAHRHELQANELGKVARKTGHFFEIYGNKILLGFCAVMIAAAAVIWWIRTSRAEQSAAWTQLADAESAEDFASVAEKFSGTTAGSWALLSESERHLETGIRMMFEDREASRTDLERAREGFEKLLSGTIPPAIEERSLLGMARVLESTSDGDTSAAVTAYGELVERFPDSVYVAFAKNRIKALESGEGQQFYAWFSSQKPAPPEPPRPRDGAGGQTGLDEMTPFERSLHETLGSGSGGASFVPPLSGGLQPPSTSGEPADSEESTAPAGDAAEAGADGAATPTATGDSGASEGEPAADETE